MVKNREKKFNKIDYMSCFVYNLPSYGVPEHFKAIPGGFRFSVFLSILLREKDSGNLLTSLLLPSSDQVMIDLEG